MTFRRTRCPHCKGKLDPGQRIHAECIDGYAEAEAAKAERKAANQARADAKVERAEMRARKREQETIPDLIKIADKAFTAYIRERDRQAGHPCISSGLPLNWSAGNQVDGGHYRSKGAASHLRYNEDNCHAQSKKQNRFLAGNAVDYRVHLINRIGIERVEALESNNEPAKWTREGLRAVIALYRKKLKEMKKC